MAEYRLSPRAQRDLDGVFDYTVTHWGLPQAMRYTDLIEAARADLAEARSRRRAVPTSDQAIDGAVSISMLSISGLQLRYRRHPHPASAYGCGSPSVNGPTASPSAVKV